MSFITKQEIRERILTLLRNQDEKERCSKSFIILEKLFQLSEFQEADSILFYASFGGEVDTVEMIKRAQHIGKKVSLPRIDGVSKIITPVCIQSLDDDLQKGPYGISQPKNDLKSMDKELLDMVVVPGVAFDRNKNRIGRGQGYYDRFLAALPKKTPKIGLAFDFQVIDKLPSIESHDITMTEILTN